MRRPRSPGFGLSVPFRKGAGRLPSGGGRRILGVGWRGKRGRRDPLRSEPVWFFVGLLLLVPTWFALALLSKIDRISFIDVAAEVKWTVAAVPVILPLLLWAHERIGPLRRQLGHEE